MNILKLYKEDSEKTVKTLAYPFVYSKFDKKQNAFSINFMTAAIAVINCTEGNIKRDDKGNIVYKEGKEGQVLRVSTDCKDTREKKIQSKAEKDIEDLREMDKCTAPKTLQIVASMFLAILFHLNIEDTQDTPSKKDTQDTSSKKDNFFIKNIKSMIDHKLANCKIVDPTFNREQKKTELANYYNNVILQINNNLASIDNFLKEDGVNRLLSNSEYTSGTSTPGGLDDKGELLTKYKRTYNKFFETYLNKLNYIRDYDIYGVTNKEKYKELIVSIPTSGITQGFSITESKGIAELQLEYNILYGDWDEEKKAYEAKNGKGTWIQKMKPQKFNKFDYTNVSSVNITLK
jgi:hypothetical protein